MATTKIKSPISKSDSWQMFNRISAKYDFLNHFLSFGYDISWRRRIAAYLPNRSSLSVLDLATGTADVVLTLVHQNDNIDTALGIDLAKNMLALGRKKVTSEQLDHIIELKHGDANQIPASDNHFDVVTMAFGIRNVENTITVLKEIYRVTKPEGRVLILEFSLPDNRLLRVLHLFYLRTIVPLIGGLISGEFHAYRYLNQTIEQFPYGEHFCRLLKQVGFKNTKANPLLFGVATIYQGDKINEQ